MLQSFRSLVLLAHQLCSERSCRLYSTLLQRAQLQHTQLLNHDLDCQAGNSDRLRANPFQPFKQHLLTAAQARQPLSIFSHKCCSAASNLLKFSSRYTNVQVLKFISTPKQFFLNYHLDPKSVTYFKSCTYSTFAQYLYIVTFKRYKFLETDNVCDQIAEAV